MILLLKIYLLSGLIIHKVIWEALKKRDAATRPSKSRSLSLLAVKAVKISILIGLVIQTLLPDVLPIMSEPLVLRIVGTAIYTIGLGTAIAARFQLGDNWADIESGRVLERQQVIAGGIYGFIRHPIYTGDLLLLLGLELALNSWLVLGVLALAPVVLLKAIKEEQMLREQLAGYKDYCMRTKRFIPFLI